MKLTYRRIQLEPCLIGDKRGNYLILDLIIGSMMIHTIFIGFFFNQKLIFQLIISLFKNVKII